MADSKKDSGERTHNTTKLKDLSSPSEHDRLLPLLNVSRVMKKALPAHAKISNEAKETVRECVSEFIAFVTAEASANCRREKRCAMSGDDLLLAMDTLGFEEYAKHLKVYLQRFREMEDEVTSAARDMGAQGSESGIGIEDYGWYEGQEYGSGSGIYGQMGGGPGSSGLGGPM